MATSRQKTKKIQVGDLFIGGQNKVLIQSMANIKTSHVEEVSAQINACAKEGADLMRVSVLDQEDARAIKDIKKRISIPLIADIHFDVTLALTALEGGIDAIRINPGNVKINPLFEEFIANSKAKNIPIRIGVNAGSVSQDTYLSSSSRVEAMLKTLKGHIDILESHDFHNIVISAKASSILETVEVYSKIAEIYDYPLHLGITEAGPKETGIIRSAAGLSPLLLNGLGDTIRISLTDDPVEEIKAAKRLLHDLGLYPDFPTFISCPTCGRTEVDLLPLASKVRAYLEENHINKTVAVMGCIVNGPGEASHADVGIAGGKGAFVLFAKGKRIASFKEEEAFPRLIEAIKNLE